MKRALVTRGSIFLLNLSFFELLLKVKKLLSLLKPDHKLIAMGISTTASGSLRLKF